MVTVAGPGPGAAASLSRRACDRDRDHSGPFYGIEIRRTEFYLAPLLQNVIHIYCTFELSGRAPIFTSIFERSYSEIRTLRGKGGYTGVDIERIPSS